MKPVRVEKVPVKEDPADPDDQHIEPDIPDDDPVNEHIPQTAAEADPDVDIFE